MTEIVDGYPVSPPMVQQPAGHQWSWAVPISILALVFSCSSLAVVLLGIGPAGCPVSGAKPVIDLPSGWSLKALQPSVTGWSFTFEGPESETVYAGIECRQSADTALSAIADNPSAGTEIGFKDVGDRVVALRSDDDSGYAVYWRNGDVLSYLTSYSDAVGVDQLEDLVQAVQGVR